MDENVRRTIKKSIYRNRDKKLYDNIVVYGKSNEENSFMYDPLYTIKTTLAGQIFICMWSERMIQACPEIKFLQTNTDGQSVMIPRKYEEKIREVNDQLTKETSLTIEEVTYNKMIIRDVNNYIGIYDDYTVENNHCKLKGDFEIDKEYHKDPSMKIVPIAVKKYFVDGIPIEETIKNHKDIFDFCMRFKTNSGCKGIFKSVDKNMNINEIKLPRTTRYYVGKGIESGILLKCFDDGRITGVNIGFSEIIFNNYEEKDIKDYNIDYSFYINEALKLKNSVYTGQLSLF
jgi:hypothetical protein